MIAVLQILLLIFLILGIKSECYRELNNVIFTTVECKEGYYVAESSFFGKKCCSIGLREDILEGTLIRFTEAEPMEYALVIDQVLRPISFQQIPFMFSNPHYYDIHAGFTQDIKDLLLIVSGLETRRELPMIKHLNTQTPIGTFTMLCQGKGEGPGNFMWDYEDTDPSSTSTQLVRRLFMDSELFSVVGYKNSDSELQPQDYCHWGPLGCPVTITGDYSNSLYGKRVQFQSNDQMYPEHYLVMDNSIRLIPTMDVLNSMFRNYWQNFHYQPIEYKSCFVEKRELVNRLDNIYICTNDGHIRMKDWKDTGKEDTTTDQVRRWVIHTEVFDVFHFNWDTVSYYAQDTPACLLQDGENIGYSDL